MEKILRIVGAILAFDLAIAVVTYACAYAAEDANAAINTLLFVLACDVVAGLCWLGVVLLVEE